MFLYLKTLESNQMMNEINQCCVVFKAFLSWINPALSFSFVCQWLLRLYCFCWRRWCFLLFVLLWVKADHMSIIRASDAPREEIKTGQNVCTKIFIFKHPFCTMSGYQILTSDVLYTESLLSLWEVPRCYSDDLQEQKYRVVFFNPE